MFVGGYKISGIPVDIVPGCGYITVVTRPRRLTRETTMSTMTKPVVSLDAVYDTMRTAFRAALTSGRNWHAVTVGTDGDPYTREEVSRCVSESEYFGKGEPYPVTVWSMTGDSSVSAEDIQDEVDAFDPAAQFEGYGGVEELTAKLERAGFVVEE